jgi:hypothetical protein
MRSLVSYRAAAAAARVAGIAARARSPQKYSLIQG